MKHDAHLAAICAARRAYNAAWHAFRVASHADDGSGDADDLVDRLAKDFLDKHDELRALGVRG